MINNSPCVQLFDRKFVANTLRNCRRCPKCRSEYSYNYDVGDTHTKSNRPMLLPCDHNMCENCVYQNRHNLICHSCLKPVEISVQHLRSISHFPVREHFDMNFFLLGELNHLRFFRKDGSANNSLLMTAQNNSVMSFNNTFGGAAAASSPAIKCTECELVPALGKCRQCKVYLCKRCFDGIHTNSKILKTHTLQNLRTQPDNKTWGTERILKPKHCKRHNHRLCDRFCPKCNDVYCIDCARNDHSTHGYTTLLDWNKKHLDDVCATLENVTLCRDHLKEGLKDIKFVENQMEEYATKTLENIASYFLKLHSFLQNEEKKIVKLFSEMSQQPQFHLRQIYAKLNKSHEVLNAMHANLELFKGIPPRDIHINRVLEKYDEQLEQLPCKLHITKPLCNPFRFKGSLDICKNMSAHFNFEYQDPKIISRIHTLNEDSNQSIMDTSSVISMDICDVSATAHTDRLQGRWPQHQKTKFKKTQQRNAKARHPSVCSTYADPKSMSMSPVPSAKNAPITQDANEVRVTHINSPEHFYIQKVSDLQEIRKLTHTYLGYEQSNRIAKILNEGYYYMTYNSLDKQWYRGILKKILPNEVYKVFLVDIGSHLELSKEKIYDIEHNHLSIPFAAIRCAIHDIVPAGKQWTEASTNLLLELVQNAPARMSIIERINNEVLKVDLQTSRTKSVRDTFLYAGLARGRPGALNFKMQLKTFSSGARSDERIPKNHFDAVNHIMVNVLHVEGPQEFYAMKSDQFEEKQEFLMNLNICYGLKDNNKLQQIYLGGVQMCCAVRLNEIWYRAVIEEIKERGKLLVRLVDEGRFETIDWREAFVLKEEFRKKREFAVRCTLADIEPLQNNSYVYTTAAVNDFKQMASNPSLRLQVVDIKGSGYKVLLFVCKKSSDMNIAASLVKNGHAISTGESTQTMELPKMCKMRTNVEKYDAEVQKICPSKKNELILNPSENVYDLAKYPTNTLLPRNTKSNKEDTMKTVKRTPVTMIHHANPGEFYIQLFNLRHGTKAFHSQIQDSQNRKYPSVNSNVLATVLENREWFANNHCLVYGNYKHSSNQELSSEWYRGIITDISSGKCKEAKYSVFLRDIGATIQTTKHHLFSIDPQLDRVTNAVYCCHLACIKPTGDNTWSHSAQDWFRHAVDTSESLSVSLQGNRTAKTPSLPVILWASVTETADPLAPCITKYSNINSGLVKAGLAHMVERLDVAKKSDNIEEIELAEGEITLEQWFQLFQDNALLNAIERNTLQTGDLLVGKCDFTMDDSSDNQIEVDSECHPFSSYLNEIDDTRIDTPPAWLTSKNVYKTIFTGFPTYLDYKCIVYMHEAEDKAFLETMRNIISNIYQGLPPTPPDYKYTANQPVIAKYHQDHRCYRAVVKSLLPSGELEIFFIDYGNCEAIEPENVRPNAPFPNLPSIANKYTISGIQLKNSTEKELQDDLDKMHNFIVNKLVSVRLSYLELGNPIKRCNLRLGTEDVASVFIEKGWADKEVLRASLPTPMAPSKLPKSRNPLPSQIDFDEPETDYEIFCEDVDHKDMNEEQPLEINWDALSEDTIEYDHINHLIEHLDENCGNRNDIPLHAGKGSAIPQSQPRHLPPPPKKRMFNDNDYTQMMNGIVVFDSDGLKSKHSGQGADDDCTAGCDGDDVVELSHKFAMNYWHNTDVDMEEEEAGEIAQQLDRRLLYQEDEDVESHFDKFHPNDTSTVISHFSGIDFFKLPQWPTGLITFHCRVVSVIAPTVLHIFPINSEFHQREVDLHRHIKHRVKSAPPITQFDGVTICLACYTRDKKWYRALIRSHNQIAKTVDVLYVDYLNSETLPMKCVRQCPRDILGWPLRTFRVRLHGVKPNPRIREHDIRQALHKQLVRQNLFAVVETPANNQTMSTEPEDVLPIRKVGPVSKIEYNDLMQLSFYKSEEMFDSKISVCDQLIEKKYLLPE